MERGFGRHTRTATAALFFVLTLFSAFPALAAEGEINNPRSTTHTLGSVDTKSQQTMITMAWDPATYTYAEIAGYNFLMDENTTYTTNTPTNSFSASAVSKSYTFTSKDSVAYYFHIMAAFAITEASGYTVNGEFLEEADTYWGPVYDKGPYYIDDTAPTIPSISIDSGAATVIEGNTVTLTMLATNASHMKVANTSGAIASALTEVYATTWPDPWSLSAGTGTKNIFAQFQDLAGNLSTIESDSIEVVSGADLSIESTKVGATSTTTVIRGQTLRVTATADSNILTLYTFTITDETPGGVVTGGHTTDAGTGVWTDLTFEQAGTFKVKVAEAGPGTQTATTGVITVNEFSITPTTASTTPGGSTVNFDPENAPAGSTITWSIVGDPSDGSYPTIDADGILTPHATNTDTYTIQATASGLATYSTATASATVNTLRIEIASGGTQTYTVGATADPLAISITEGSSAPTDEYYVLYQVTSEPDPGAYTRAIITGSAGQAQPYTASTIDGLADTTVQLGSKVGTYVVTATSEYTTSNTPTVINNSPRTFTLTAIAAEAAKLTISSGDDQTGSVGSQLAEDFVVLVTDQYDNPVLGETVAFAGPAGYTLSNDTAVTNEAGLAGTRLTLGAVPGPYTATAAATSFVYTATFNITSVGEITSLTITQNNANDCVLTWNAAGGTFNIFYTDGAYSANAIDYTQQAGGDISATIATETYGYTDTCTTGTVTAAATERYYLVKFKGTDIFKKDIGKFTVTANEGFNLISTPLTFTYTALTETIGTQVEGGNSSGTATNIWDNTGTGPDNYIYAWLVDAGGDAGALEGKWLKTTAMEETDITLAPGKGYWLQIRSGGTKNIVLVGNVLQENKTISINTGFNLIGMPYPVTVLLVNSNLKESGADGGNSSGTATNIWDNTGTGADNYIYAWLVDAGGDAGALEGKWLKTTAMEETDITLAPGKGYWLQIRDSDTAFTWTFTKPY